MQCCIMFVNNITRPPYHTILVYCVSIRPNAIQYETIISRTKSKSIWAGWRCIRSQYLIWIAFLFIDFHIELPASLRQCVFETISSNQVHALKYASAFYSLYSRQTLFWNSTRDNLSFSQFSEICHFQIKRNMTQTED